MRNKVSMHYLHMYTLATNGAKCYITQQWLEWLLSHGLHLNFYLLSCTCYSKTNVMFLLSVECRFQRYQGWPGLTKSNGAGIRWHLTIFIVSPPINTNRKYSLSTIGWMAEWLTHWAYNRTGRVRIPLYYFNWECYQLHGFTPFIEFILWRSRLGSVWSPSH